MAKHQARRTGKGARGAQQTRRPKDGPHWRVMSVPGYQDDGGDTWWYITYGRTQRREEIGRGDASMRTALAEVNSRNEKARARLRRARRS